MLVITGVVFFVCLAPFETISLLQMLSGYLNDFTFDNEKIHDFVQICRVLMYINAATNSIIYVMASSQYRLAFRKVFAVECILCSRFGALKAPLCESKTQQELREIWTFNHDVNGVGMST